jgi:hypothetical protein
LFAPPAATFGYTSVTRRLSTNIGASLFDIGFNIIIRFSLDLGQIGTNLINEIDFIPTTSEEDLVFATGDPTDNLCAPTRVGSTMHCEAHGVEMFATGTSIPEPTSLALLASGLIGLLFMARRQWIHGLRGRWA